MYIFLLKVSAYRELLKDTNEESEFLNYLKQIWIFCDNAEEMNSEEILYILLLSIKKGAGFSQRYLK